MSTDDSVSTRRRPEPATSPAGLGPEATFCPLCPGWYALKDIWATSASGEVRSWAEVLLRVARPSDSRRLFHRQPSKRGPVLSQRQRAIIAAKSFTPMCPHNHKLPNSIDAASVVGVIGNVGSSKSHYLAGLAYELVHEQPMRHLKIDVAYLGEEAREMDNRVRRVYAQGEILDRSEAGRIDGPFSYRLTVNNASIESSRRVLTFFDVAGEDCVGLTRSAEFVRYLFNASGIILLIDPGGIPVLGHPLAAQGSAALTTRAVIDGLADAMEAVTGMSSREQPQTIVITVAKADSANLGHDVWPPPVWPDDRDETRISRQDMKRRLREHSDRCRTAVIELGARGIVEAAETRFNKTKVCYAVISATSEAPVDGRWSSPRPIGCAIPLAQILMSEVDQWT